MYKELKTFSTNTRIKRDMFDALLTKEIGRVKEIERILEKEGSSFSFSII